MRTAGQDRGLGSATPPVRTASNASSDTESAVESLLDDLEADAASFTFVFFSSEHDAQTVSRVLDRRVGSAGVGGTTSGEISSEGFAHGEMVGLSLHGTGVRAAADVIPNLDELSLVPITQLPDQLARRIGRTADELSEDRHVWVTLVDSSSGSEDLLTSFFKKAAPSTFLVGGSVGGKELHRQPELVYHGRVYRNAAALVLLEYDGPFEPLHHSHLEFTDTTLEVTEVSRDGRILEQLDGQPAAEAYANGLGVAPEELDHEMAVQHPLGFRFRGRPFACSVVDILDRSRLQMANTIHPGESLRILEAGDLVTSTRDELREAIESFEREHGTEPIAALFFHCNGRFLEARYDGSLDDLAESLDQLPFVGFNTYGEQFNALHTNHTLTGLLFG